MPETGNTLLGLVAFVVPGFVTLTIAERTHAVREDVSPFERLLQALYYSVLVYLSLGLLAVVLDAASSFGTDDIKRIFGGTAGLATTTLAAVLALLVFPMAIATASRLWLTHDPWGVRACLLRRLGVSPTHRTASPWAHLFEQRIAAYLRIWLDDGSVVGGYYGPGSAAAYGAGEDGLFLRELHALDSEHWFGPALPRTLGAWIPRERIIRLEVYAVSDEQQREVLTGWSAAGRSDSATARCSRRTRRVHAGSDGDAADSTSQAAAGTTRDT